MDPLMKRLYSFKLLAKHADLVAEVPSLSFDKIPSSLAPNAPHASLKHGTLHPHFPCSDLVGLFPLAHDSVREHWKMMHMRLYGGSRNRRKSIVGAAAMGGCH
jgi:hypothetical protein